MEENDIGTFEVICRHEYEGCFRRRALKVASFTQAQRFYPSRFLRAHLQLGETFPHLESMYPGGPWGSLLPRGLSSGCAEAWARRALLQEPSPSSRVSGELKTRPDPESLFLLPSFPP